MTAFEQKQTESKEEKVEILGHKVENLSGDVLEIKEMLKTITLKSISTPTVSAEERDTQDKDCNVWMNKTRTDNVRQLLMIGKDNDGNNMDNDNLLKTCVDNGIKVKKTFKTASEETGVVLHSEKSAELLTQKLKEQQYNVKNIPTRTPTIDITGIPKSMTKESLLYNILQLNEYIKDICENPMNTGDEKFEIVGTVDLKSNNNFYKASIRVSNVIRYAIHNNGNRLLIGLSSCQVKDNLYRPRCFKCQKYGHRSNWCKSDVNVCGHYILKIMKPGIVQSTMIEMLQDAVTVRTAVITN